MPSAPRRSFEFTKWYVDCVDGSDVIIAYWTSLAWRGMTLTWHSVARFAADGTHEAHASVRPCDPPVIGRDAIIWKAPRLKCEITAQPCQPAMAAAVLFEGVEWQCLAPSARVRVVWADGHALRGTGYAERIVMRVPPWELGIRELRWGRWISADASRSAVWIGWTGGTPCTLVFVDGRRVAGGQVTDDTIAGSDVSIALGERRTLLNRTLGKTLSRIPMLKRTVPKSLLALRETKWLRSGILRVASAPPVAGTAIDEVAVFA